MAYFVEGHHTVGVFLLKLIPDLDLAVRAAENQGT